MREQPQGETLDELKARIIESEGMSEPVTRTNKVTLDYAAYQEESERR